MSWYHIHLVVIPSDSERKATVDDGVGGLVVGVLQRTGCEEGIVGRVERYGPKFLPIPHIRLFRQDFM